MDDSDLLLRCFEYIITNIANTVVEPKLLLQAMIDFLSMAPTAVVVFAPFFALLSEDQDHAIATVIGVSILPILRAFVLSANTIGHLILEPYKTLLSSLPPGSLSLNDLLDHLETVSLTIRSTDLALDLLLGCMQPCADRLTAAKPQVVQHLLRNLSAIALDHIEEAETVAKRQQGLFVLKLHQNAKTGTEVEVEFRIDATGTPRTSSHIRLTTASIPENRLVGANYTIDALVIFSETGRARFRCLHPLPPYFAECSWIIEDCGPFVTTKCMIDAVGDLDILLEGCCGIAGAILGIAPLPVTPRPEQTWNAISRLNPSQNQGISLALNNPLLCLWGPPGTGKTETIVEMMCALQIADEEARVLITAPTHNAVDNVMRRYMERIHNQPLYGRKPPIALRVSTEVKYLKQKEMM
jgi:regulator of nonsense transcripts 1